MPVVLLTPADKPAMVALFNQRSPMATIGAPLPATGFDSDFARAGAKLLGNKANNGTLNAVALSFPLEHPWVNYNLAFGSTMTGIRNCLRQSAVLWLADGYTHWDALIPQDAEFGPFRDFMALKWPDRIGEESSLAVTDTRRIILRRFWGTMAELAVRA